MTLDNANVDLDTIENTSIICDICDKHIKHADHCILHVSGIKEGLQCHPDCIRIFMKCKGNFSTLPPGRLRRVIEEKQADSIVIHNTGITIRSKQARYIIEGLRVSPQVGYDRIKSMAVDFYALVEPKHGEFYTIDHNKQIVLMRLIDTYDIEEVSRDTSETG
jgi:hypothetical protein